MRRINSHRLEGLIKNGLTDFYRRRVEAVYKLKLEKALSKKNPYLFRAMGVQKASEIVEEILRAYTSSSDETIFGDAFFEPIAKVVGGGRVGPAEGVDILRESRRVITAISVKSGPNWGNSSQWKKQKQDFENLRSRLYKTHKMFDALMGYGYGNKYSDPDPKKGGSYRVRSGQAFWRELTGDGDFYLKLGRLMKGYPQRHRRRYQKEWDRAVNRFERQFLITFSSSKGDINWEKLVKFNSGEKK